MTRQDGGLSREGKAVIRALMLREVSLGKQKKPPRVPGAALDSSEVSVAAYFFFAAFLAAFFAAGAALPSSIAAWAAARRATGTR